MKCNQCGGNLRIQDERCPYCGIENPHYKKHRAQMRYFQKEYQDTKEEVLQESRRFTGFTVRITVIAVLVALDLLMILLGRNAWDVARMLQQREIAKNLPIYQAELQRLEEQEDYIGLSYYYGSKSLYGNEKFREYQVVNQLCGDYGRVYTYLMRLGNEDEYTSDKDLVNYMNDSLDYICERLEKLEEKNYYQPECYEGIHGETIETIKYNIQVLLTAYAGVPKEEAEKFWEMSEGQRHVTIEKGVGIGEE